jgi:hypothetical protein
MASAALKTLGGENKLLAGVMAKGIAKMAAKYSMAKMSAIQPSASRKLESQWPVMFSYSWLAKA